MSKAFSKLKPIRALVLDCDGILTDGRIWQDCNGEWKRAFNILDGMGLKTLLNKNIILGIITGSKGKDIKDRFELLGVKYIYQGIEDKKSCFEGFLKQTQLTSKQVAYMGDDLPDIPVLKEVGFAVSVPNAMSEVSKLAHYKTKRAGGDGAVREICDLILKYSKEIR